MSLLLLFLGVGVQAPTENEGTCTQTLGALTCAATGTLDITGSCEATLGDLTCQATDIVTVVVDGAAARPVIALRGAWAAPAAHLHGELDVRIAARGAWVGRGPQPAGRLDLRVSLAGAWVAPALALRARGVVANPGEHVVVVEADDECLVIVQ